MRDVGPLVPSFGKLSKKKIRNRINEKDLNVKRP